MKIDYYKDYISEELRLFLLEDSKPVFKHKKLKMRGKPKGLETAKSMKFLIDLFEIVGPELKKVLQTRTQDRKFIDKKTRSFYQYNKNLNITHNENEYQTILGERDSNDRIVIGPHSSNYIKSNQKPVAPIPDYLQDHHVTLFGPPDSEKMCINAMNAFHRKLKNEPKIVEELIKDIKYTPKWGADNEDSKTPMHEDLQSAGVNLSAALDHKIHFKDEANGKEYKLEKDHLSHAIKRFPGLALPCFFLFYDEQPFPLHIYDLALHAFKNWHNKEALVFYVPKLENEEEARYIKLLMQTTEQLLQKIHPEYEMGTIRLMIVLENPRAVFRVNEIMDELHPYFVGASLGWHDYLGSTARLFKNNPDYRIPVKADPDIVIKYIKASHDLLSNVVGERGGIKVGGMYGILPTDSDLNGPSLQITLKGYIRDVVTQLKRNLNGFWVAHPDFVRIGLALVEAWKLHQKGNSEKLDQLIQDLLQQEYHQEILDFVHGPDIQGLDYNNPLYARSLIVADIGESNIIANNDPREIRYNVFQSLQYLTDWLSGNGCVALPTIINDTPVRIMDDLATAERSRWEVWHELFHGRFDLFEFLKIAHEEYHFIRKDLSNEKKIVQVKWDTRTEKWYPVAFKLMIKLMTEKNPCEFAPELLLPFTISDIRQADDPWQKADSIDSKKFKLRKEVELFNHYFELCGEMSFARPLSTCLITDKRLIEESILSFDKQQVINASYFHGDIGENKKSLDSMAKDEQKDIGVNDKVLNELKLAGKKYEEKFGFKFLISAKGKSGTEMLNVLNERLVKDQHHELNEARKALLEITLKRLEQYPPNDLYKEIDSYRNDFKVPGLQVGLCLNGTDVHVHSFGKRNDKDPVTDETVFEIASLSKSVGSAVALDFFRQQRIHLNTNVDHLLETYGSSFKLDQPKLKLKHLMSHSALNMHYVNGIPLTDRMPNIEEFLFGNKKYGYDPIEVINEPGTKFSYSGAGFIVLEHLLEIISKKKFSELLDLFLKKINVEGLKTTHQSNYSYGFKDNGEVVETTRLQYPLIAAGLMSHAKAMTEFLCSLSAAHGRLNHPIHDISARMLFGMDVGSVDFMNASMGLGIFIAEAGQNRIMLHQGANDGYRSLFLFCYCGPDKGKGFTLLANSEFQSVLLNSKVAQLLLKELNFSGIDFTSFSEDFSTKGLKQEEIVNLGYKNLIFDAFKKNRAEVIPSSTLCPLAKNNILKDAKVISVSNDRFARAENLISPFKPYFDPTAFGSQGKIMDSWESERHNEHEFECLHLKLTEQQDAEYVFISTKYHDGNQVEAVEIMALIKEEWVQILPKVSMGPHAYLKIKLNEKFCQIQEVKIRAYPDGGLTRVVLLDSLTKTQLSQFAPLSEAKSKRFKDKIPSSTKPLMSDYDPSKEEIELNISRLRTGQYFNNASAAFGAKILSATDEHYSPAKTIISPFGPLNMFDGLESARSRTPNHKEEVIIELAKNLPLKTIVIDFSYFINNAPKYMEIFYKKDNEWKVLVGKNEVKPFRGTLKSYEVVTTESIKTLKLCMHPDGGFNRIHVFAQFK